MAAKNHEVGAVALAVADVVMRAVEYEVLRGDCEVLADGESVRRALAFEQQLAEHQRHADGANGRLEALVRERRVEARAELRARAWKRNSALARMALRAWPGLRVALALAGLWDLGDHGGDEREDEREDDRVTDDGVRYGEQEKVDGEWRRRAEFDAPGLVQSRRELAAVLGLVFAESNGAGWPGEPRVIDDTHIEALLRRVAWRVGDGELSVAQLEAVAGILERMPDTVPVDVELLEAIQVALNSGSDTRTEVVVEAQAEIVEAQAVVRRRLGPMWKRSDRETLTIGVVASREVAMVMNSRDLLETITWLVGQVMREASGVELSLVVDGAAWTWTMMDAVRAVLAEDGAGGGWAVRVIESTPGAASQTRAVTATRLRSTGPEMTQCSVDVEVANDVPPATATADVLFVMGNDARCKRAVLEHQEHWHGRSGAAPAGWCVWSIDGRDPLEVAELWQEAIERADDRQRASEPKD
jgi:hypothetical protein